MGSSTAAAGWPAPWPAGGRRSGSWPDGAAAAGRADDQRHHVLVLAGLQPDAVDAARPAGRHLERQAGRPAGVGEVVLVEVRGPVLARADWEALGAGGPVPPGHAERGGVDQRPVPAAGPGVADPVRWQRRVRGEPPLVAQAPGPGRGRVGGQRGHGGAGERAGEQPGRVDLPVERALRRGPRTAAPTDDPLGRGARAAQVVRPGPAGSSWQVRVWPGRGSRAGLGAGEHGQRGRPGRVPAGRGEVPGPGAEHRPGRHAARLTRGRLPGQADPLVRADAQFPAVVPGPAGHQALRGRATGSGRTTASRRARPGRAVAHPARR